jgi:hypothetical protein
MFPDLVNLRFPDKFRECTDITVHVCKERVCVDQRLPLNLDFIRQAPGSQGSFSLPRADKFTTTDYVRGWDSWNATYHRHHSTHSGGIEIWASLQLAEAAVVDGIGIEFRPEISAGIGNGGWAVGDHYVFLPDNTGRVKMFHSVGVLYQQPGGVWTPWQATGEVLYLDHGPVNSNVAPIFTVLGTPGPKDVSFSTPGSSFAAGTQFLLQANLRYWIDGNGADGEASASYELTVHPYILVKSCTDQWPESILVRVRDYL